MRGRQGQAERRLDTLWQLQETTSENQATLTRLQQDIERNQQQLLQQQHNMIAIQAQIQQLDGRCETNSSTGKQFQQVMTELQTQLDGLGRNILHNQDELAAQQRASQAADSRLHDELLQQAKQLQDQLDKQQQGLENCDRDGLDALDKCEQLRQGAVVLDRRLDGVAAQIQDAVQPVSSRLAALDASVAKLATAAANGSTAVQHHQLTAALAQMSAAAVRQQQEFKAQLAGLAGRLEVLEVEAARQEMVVLQEEFKRKLSQLHDDMEVAIVLATGPLAGQLKSKADASQLTTNTNNLSTRMATSEQQLLLGLKSVGDKTAMLLQHKADAAAVEAWKHQVEDELAKVKAEVAQAVQLAAKSIAHAVRHDRKGLQATSADTATAAAALRAAAAGEESGSLQAQPAEGDNTQQFEQGAAQQGSVAECVAAAAAALGPDDAEEASAAAAISAATPNAAVNAASIRQASARVSTVPAAPAGQPAAAVLAVQLNSAAEAAHCSAASTEIGNPTATVLRPLTGTVSHLKAGGSQGSPSDHGSFSINTTSSLRPISSVQPWASSPTAGTNELLSAVHNLSAAHNAKMAKAARDREAARNKLSLSRSVVAAVVQDTTPPAPEEVAQALQQQLNIMGLSPNSPEKAAAGKSPRAGAAARSPRASAEAAAMGAEAAASGPNNAGVCGALDSALAAAGANVCVAPCIDGSGRLVAPSAIDPSKAVGVLSGSTVVVSLRHQSAPHISTAASSSTSSKLGRLTRTSSAITGLASKQRPLPGMMSQQHHEQQQQQVEQLPAVQSPTADDLRALLRSTSSGGSRGNSAVAALRMPALRSPGGAGTASQHAVNGSAAESKRGSASGAEAQGGEAGRISPSMSMKQSSMKRLSGGGNGR